MDQKQLIRRELCLIECGCISPVVIFRCNAFLLCVATIQGGYMGPKRLSSIYYTDIFSFINGGAWLHVC